MKTDFKVFIIKVFHRGLGWSKWEGGFRGRRYRSSVHGILQARILEWVAVLFSRDIYISE